MRKIAIIMAVALAFSSLPAVAFKTPVKAEEFWPEGPNISTEYAIVMEINSGTVLYEKQSEVANFPASITKIMTTLLALENCELNEIVTFSDDAINKTPGDSTHIARDYGEKMTMEECLYAVMLGSANECAYAVAEHVGTKLGGGYETFIQLMNTRARELGCTTANFVNASGLPDKKHVISAKDMAIIARAAYQNETFRIITGTKTYKIPPTNKHKEVTIVHNHHKMLHAYQTSAYVYPYCTGGKNGYTKAAQYTLVTYAEKDGLSLVSVVMKTGSKEVWTESTEILDYCFQNFKAFNLAEHDSEMNNSENSGGIVNNYGPYVDLDANAYIVLPATASFADVTSTMEDIDGSGKQIAKINYTYAGRNVGSVDVVVSGNKVEENYFDKAQPEDAGPEHKIVEIKPLYIVTIVLVLGFLILLIVLLKALYDNYYVLLHRLDVRRRRKERFKPVNKKKRRRRKSDSMFY